MESLVENIDILFKIILIIDINTYTISIVPLIVSSLASRVKTRKLFTISRLIWDKKRLSRLELPFPPLLYTLKLDDIWVFKGHISFYWSMQFLYQIKAASLGDRFLWMRKGSLKCCDPILARKQYIRPVIFYLMSTLFHCVVCWHIYHDCIGIVRSWLS